MIEQAVFLAGGRGTRLGPLTTDTPKPLLRVGSQPFLDYLIVNAARHGIRKFVLIAGYLGTKIADRYPRWGDERGLRIECVIEPEPAGTGGALHHAAALLDKEFLLANGDSFFDINLLDLATLRSDADWIAKIALRQVSDTSRYGKIYVEGTRIAKIAERGGSGPGMINGGIYVARRSILDWIVKLPCSIEADVFPKLVAAGRLIGREYGGFFIDIGIDEDFARAQAEMPRRTCRPAAFLSLDSVLNRDRDSSTDKLRWRDGAVEAIKDLNDRGYFTFVFEGSRSVDTAGLPAMQRRMACELAQRGAHIEAFYYRQLTSRHESRESELSLISPAFDRWPIERSRSFLVSETVLDIVQAQAANVKGSLCEPGNLSQAVAAEIGKVPS